MAGKENIMKVLAAESGPITLLELGKKLGLPTTNFTTQVIRMKEHGEVEVNENKEYFITDKGREVIEAEGKDLPPAGLLQRSENPQAVISQYQKFIQLGLQAGVTNQGLRKATADHVWNGGEFSDPVWVRQALKEADIQPDLANRWTAFWRTYLGKPLTKELVAATQGSESAAKDGKPLDKGVRSHMLDENDKPIYVGEGLGDLDYRDAVHLSEVRAASRARGGVGNGHGQPQTMGDIADQLVKVVAAVDQFRGQQAPGRNFVVKPKADGTGGFEVAEVVPGEPMVIPAPTPPQGAKSYMMNPQTGVATELETGKPNVFFLPAPAQPIAQVAANTVRYLVDKASGLVTPITGNEPIIIQASPAQAPPVIQFKDKDGNPLTLDISTYFQLEEHKAKMEREKDSHEVKMEISKAAKDFLKNAAEVAQKMAQKKA